MSLPKPNKKKKLVINVKGIDVARYPIRTKLFEKGDDIVKEVVRDVNRYLKFLKDKNVVIVLGEKAVSATQGRAILIKDIKPGKLAEFLSRFVTKSKVGIGLGMAETMELAIQQVGVFRILLAFLAAALTRPFGIKGMFYRVAGDKARSIDGPTPHTIPPYNQYAVMAPENPDKVAEDISKKLQGIPVVIIDANDIGQNILGSDHADKQLVEFVKFAFKDNPLGQSDEQTPLAIVAWDK